MENDFKIDVTVGDVIFYICTFACIHTEFQPQTSSISQDTNGSCQNHQKAERSVVYASWLPKPIPTTWQAAHRTLIRDMGQAC